MVDFEPGVRAKTAGDPAVYLIDPEGYRRHIPNPEVYGRLFKSWDGIIVDDGILNVA